MVHAILGCIIFVLFIVWVLAEIAHVSAKLRAIFAPLMSEEPSGVDSVLDQMYGSGKGTEHEYAATRNAKAQRMRKGDKHGKG